MLAQDTLTGALYEVPEPALYGWGLGESPYDGLGFPGLIGNLFKGVTGLIGGGLPGLPNIGNLLGPLRGLLPGGAPGLPMPPGLPGLPMPPGLPGLPNIGSLLGRLRGMAAQPPRYIRPPLPFTGFGPKRMYMRCSVWPGVRPAGVVAAPGVPVPGVVTPLPGVPPAVAPGGFMRRRRRIRRRR